MWHEIPLEDYGTNITDASNENRFWCWAYQFLSSWELLLIFSFSSDFVQPCSLRINNIYVVIYRKPRAMWKPQDIIRKFSSTYYYPKSPLWWFRSRFWNPGRAWEGVALGSGVSRAAHRRIYSRSDTNTTKRSPFYAHNNFSTTTLINLY